MQFADVVAQRWSCRAFRADPVPASTLVEVFSLANRTASWCNTQPWRVHLVSGSALDALGRSLVDAATGGTPTNDLPMDMTYEGEYADRRRRAGYALYASVGIDRKDRVGRDRQMLRNFTFFGAPHAAVVTTTAALGTYGAIDCGGFVANVLNAAHSLGVATVAQAAPAVHSAVLRDHLGFDDSRNAVCVVSMGYADEEHPINTFRTERAELSEMLTVVS